MAARQNSHWLGEAIAQGEEECPSLIGNISADVCIVGGGFTGLWTALNLKQQDPALDVVVIEKDACGAGGPNFSHSRKFVAARRLCAWPPLLPIR